MEYSNWTNLDPSNNDKVGDKDSTPSFDLTFKVICIINAQSLDEALMEGLPNHPLVESSLVDNPAI